MCRMSEPSVDGFQYLEQQLDEDKKHSWELHSWHGRLEMTMTEKNQYQASELEDIE